MDGLKVTIAFQLRGCDHHGLITVDFQLVYYDLVDTVKLAFFKGILFFLIFGLPMIVPKQLPSNKDLYNDKYEVLVLECAN